MVEDRVRVVGEKPNLFVVRSPRGGEFVEANFKRGKLKNEKKGKNPKESDDTFVEFEPDSTVIHLNLALM